MLSSKDSIDRALLAKREYVGISEINGPLIYIKNTHNIGYQELVECSDKEGNVRLGNVLDTSKDVVVVQLFESTTGLNCQIRA